MQNCLQTTCHCTTSWKTSSHTSGLHTPPSTWSLILILLHHLPGSPYWTQPTAGSSFVRYLGIWLKCNQTFMYQQLIHSCCGIPLSPDYRQPPFWALNCSTGGLFCTICQELDFLASQCTLVVVHATSHLLSCQQTRMNICFCWNLKQCVFPHSCSFRHVCQKNHRAIDFPKVYAGNSAQLCLNLLSFLSHDAELDSGSNWFYFISCRGCFTSQFYPGAHGHGGLQVLIYRWRSGSEQLVYPLAPRLVASSGIVSSTYHSTAACAALPSLFCPVHSGWATVLFLLNYYNVSMSAVEHLEVVYEFCMKHYQ